MYLFVTLQRRSRALTPPRITAAQPCSGSSLSDKERQASGKFNLNCTFYRREQKQTLISHCGIWLISNSWFASSNKHKCRVNIVKQEEVNADMFTAYQTVFEGLGCVPGTQTIKMNSNVILVGKYWRR